MCVSTLSPASPVHFLRSPRRAGVTLAGSAEATDRARSAPVFEGKDQSAELPIPKSPSTPEGSPQKLVEVEEHLAACAIQVYNSMCLTD
jgi:hypothetical protein